MEVVGGHDLPSSANFHVECTLCCLNYFAQIPRKTRQGSGQTVEWTPIQILIMPFNFISMCILASPGLTELCKAMIFGGSCSRCTDSHAFRGRFSKALPAAWPRLKAVLLEPAPTTILQSASFPHTCSWQRVWVWGTGRKGSRRWKKGSRRPSLHSFHSSPAKASMGEAPAQL